MKPINVYFEDEEMIFLKDLKKDDSWRDFILNLANYRLENNNEKEVL